MNANDTNKVISALQSFADRLKNDPVAGTIYEGDWDTLIDAQTYLHQQQSEIGVLKKSINEALASIPAYGEQGFYFEHHDINGEYLGHSSIHAEDVVQRIEAILIKAQEK